VSGEYTVDEGNGLMEASNLPLPGSGSGFSPLGLRSVIFFKKKSLLTDFTKNIDIYIHK